MLTDAEIDRIAQAFVADSYPPGCEVLHREPFLIPDGIYFQANRPGDDVHELYLGYGGFFVARSNGEVWSVGSGQIVHEGLQYWLNWYAEGWRPGNYRLVVRSVAKATRLAELIVLSHATYLMREVTSGVVWERHVPYTSALVLDRLHTLPCAFILGADQVRFIVKSLGSPPIADVVYEHVGPFPSRDWHPENNDLEQLGPQYEIA